MLSFDIFEAWLTSMKTLSVSYSPGTLSGLMAPRPAATTTTAAAAVARVQKNEANACCAKKFLMETRVVTGTF